MPTSRVPTACLLARSRRLALLIAMALSIASASAAQWQPTLDAGAKVGPFEGRPVDSYRHGAKPEWGYPKEQHDRFLVVHPESKPASPAPLYVVLHSAGHTVDTALSAGFRKDPDGSYNHGLYHPPADHYGLYLDCRANTADWWWGWKQIEGDPAAFAGTLTPVEARVIDTVLWVAEKYGIDRDRIYLSGISMGGTGSLGIGLRRGDIFAAMMVWVPAGAKHVAYRVPMTGAAAGAIDGGKMPDPPLVVDLSAQDDGFSDGQEAVIDGMRARKYPLVYGWGLFGHTGSPTKIASTSDIALAFPWLEVRRDEAYPVFTGATSDQKPPWPRGGPGDAKGQINAFFRWKSVTDTKDAIAMQLRLLKAGEVASTYAFPAESTADVTLRRLQRFAVKPGTTYAWTLERDGKPVATGTVKPDAEGLLTVPKVTVTQAPAVLTIKRR